MNQRVVHSARFAIDSLPGMVFEGYSDGSDWNGWACPFFVKAEAEKVLTASEANGYLWRLDEVQDAFVVQSADDPDNYEPETFGGTTLNVDGKEIRVYGVGAYSWIWEEAEIQPDET